MMTGAASRRIEAPAPGLVKVLDDLTTRHSLMVERFGEIWSDAPEPYDPIFYAAKAASLAAAIDNAATADEKRIALLESEAARHEQIGKLALHIAAYEAAYGDPGNVPAMRELGRDHMELAARLQQTLDDELVLQGAARSDGKAPQGEPEILTLEAVERDPMNAVNMPLPDDASPELLEAALEATTANWQNPGADARITELFERDAALTAAGSTHIPLGTNPDLDHDPDGPSGGMSQKGQDMSDALELLSLEAIERDPWNAVNLFPPDNDDLVLWAKIEQTASGLVAQKAAEMDAIEATPGGLESDAYAKAEEAGFEAEQRRLLAEEVLEQAGQEPALIVDEAAMLSSRHISRVLERARVAGAKVVLAGDDKQQSDSTSPEGGKSPKGSGLLSGVSDQTRAEAETARTHQQELDNTGIDL